MHPGEFELVFLADLPPLSIATYALHATPTPQLHARAIIYSNYYA